MPTQATMERAPTKVPKTPRLAKRLRRNASKVSVCLLLIVFRCFSLTFAHVAETNGSEDEDTVKPAAKKPRAKKTVKKGVVKTEDDVDDAGI